jgi:hypothetical protein
MPHTNTRKTISIRQPYAELIMMGEKTAEYRSRATTHRGVVNVYATKKKADSPSAWRLFMDASGQEDCDHFGMIIGTVEITGCEWSHAVDCFIYHLANPVRCVPFRPNGTPMPCFWWLR